MTQVKSNRKVCRGRIFPQIQWTQEQKAQWKAEREVFKECCQPIFAQVQQSLIKTHYNWYMAVEPESGEYFINEDALGVAHKAHQKYSNARLANATTTIIPQFPEPKIKLKLLWSHD